MDENKLNEILVSNQTLSQKSGLGLQIVNDLAKAINCKLHFKTALNKGFSVTIIINK